MMIKGGEYISELARRTWENYKFIKNIADEDGNRSVYEVTQLINSMYCMLVVPQQVFGMYTKDVMPELQRKETNLKNKSTEDYNKLLDIVEELNNQGRIYYNEWQKEKKEKSPVCTLIYSLRNALCHNGVGFMPVDSNLIGRPDNTITDIVFETRYYPQRDELGNPIGEGDVSFIAKIEIETLEHLIESISKVYGKAEERSRSSDPYKKLFNRIYEDNNKYLGFCKT